VNAARNKLFALVISPLLLEEYIEVVHRPHIAEKYKKITERADAIVNFLRMNAILVAGTPTERIVPDDPNDDVVIACAIEGDADYIVSGDSHLTNLGKYRSIKILTPKEFVTHVLKKCD
jgi:hypothetical protein